MNRKSFLTLSLVASLFFFLAGFSPETNTLSTGIKSLPRSTPEAENINAEGISNYLKAVKESNQDLHSLMIVRHGKVVFETWLGDNAADKNHVMNSVSKTFTSMAIGFAVAENRLKVTDKVISFFPDKLPAEVSPFLGKLEVRHLMTMSAGQDLTLVNAVQKRTDVDWVQALLAIPIKCEPGTVFEYSSLATYLAGAIIQKLTGEKLIDYLESRLFGPLGIVGATWKESPQGLNLGGSGMYIKTEDMAKLGQFLLQKGKWNGKQILPESWITDASTAKISKIPIGTDELTRAKLLATDDWMQGYGYMLWRCRHNVFRADGAGGQFIIVVPEKDAVIVATAQISDMQAELNLIWDYLLPALK